MIEHRIVLGDGIVGMRDLPKGSAALVFNDPPLGKTRAKWDEALNWSAWWEAIDHVLRPGGLLVAVGDLRFFATIAPLAKRRFSYDLIWSKNRKTRHLDAKKRPLLGHETLFVFGVGDGSVFNPQFTYGHEPMHGATRRSMSELYNRESMTTTIAGRTERYQDSVLEIDCVANDSDNRIHSTQKPIELVRWCLRAYTNEGDLVVDPTCGSGSMIHAARSEKRSAVGWEKDPVMHDKAQRWFDGRDTPLFSGVGLDAAPEPR